MVTTLPRLGSVTSEKSIHRWAYSLSSCSAFRIEPPVPHGFTKENNREHRRECCFCRECFKGDSISKTAFEWIDHKMLSIAILGKKTMPKMA